MMNSRFRIGVDIGGTHIAAALTDALDGCCLEGTYARGPVDPQGSATSILEAWAAVINTILKQAGHYPVECIGIAMPGPFDYQSGTALIRGLAKYENLYGINIREGLLDRIDRKDIPIFFGNDAACFGLGEVRTTEGAQHSKVIAITLGTGLGACFIDGGKLQLQGKGVASQGYLYNFPFLNATAEDYISARWLLNRFKELTGQMAGDVLQIAELASTDDTAQSVFREFGSNLGRFIGPRIRDFEADCLIIGGSISHSKDLFIDALMAGLNGAGTGCTVYFSGNNEQVAMEGAASLIDQQGEGEVNQYSVNRWSAPARRTTQPQLPHTMPSVTDKGYRIFPFESLGSGQIHQGYDSLAKWMIKARKVRIDGYEGLDWDHLRQVLSAGFRKAGVKALWYETKAFLRAEDEIETLVAPYLGTNGSVWGTKTHRSLSDLYQPELLDWAPGDAAPGDAVPGDAVPGDAAELIILAGTGAGLSAWDAPIVYVDLPKNELQYRMRAGSATNLGTPVADNFSDMYKRAYFFDWVVLNRHRRAIKDSIVIVADGQWDTTITWTLSTALYKGMHSIARNVIRNRPWFEPGVWGGNWLKQHIPALSRDEVNYAWSFELIAPESGLVFESDGNLLEISFDWLMEAAGEKVLGADFDRFGLEFPIRFDFLDTVDGGNLSIQCHPSPDYIRDEFGESFTQDETYYILDKKGDAGVYLGFQENIDPTVFRQALEDSQAEKKEIDIERFVQRLPSEKHDLFLIPNRTVHGAGVGNLVLEISATPYIFTFKMYDWMRMDLDGPPRPINIEHAFRNLDFSRSGKKVREELVSVPVILKEEQGLTTELLPTHPEHFYAVHRLNLAPGKQAVIPTDNKCHLLMLVEGEVAVIRTREGREWEARYAETFVLPAAADSYELINHGDKPIKLVKAFIK